LWLNAFLFRCSPFLLCLNRFIALPPLHLLSLKIRAFLLRRDADFTAKAIVRGFIFAFANSLLCPAIHLGIAARLLEPHIDDLAFGIYIKFKTR
jgi:hypothetical protein